jgi:hypothetical protein
LLTDDNKNTNFDDLSEVSEVRDSALKIDTSSILKELEESPKPTSIDEMFELMKKSFL